MNNENKVKDALTKAFLYLRVANHLERLDYNEEPKISFESLKEEEYQQMCEYKSSNEIIESMVAILNGFDHFREIMKPKKEDVVELMEEYGIKNPITPPYLYPNFLPDNWKPNFPTFYCKAEENKK